VDFLTGPPQMVEEFRDERLKHGVLDPGHE
jgi:hypothetical protein